MDHAYKFLTSWFFRAPIEKVFAEIDAVEQWPTWWKGVLEVKALNPGAAKLGSVTHNRWRAVLPYELEFDATVTRHEPPRLIEVDARGQLIGNGRWELEPERGGTRVRYHWHVSTTKPWMNAIAPIARPFFGWNHATVMRWGGEALARRLGVALEP